MYPSSQNRSTWHIHMKGIVQGVGFRPFVYRMAVAKGLKGWVNNTDDGVHIEINATETEARHFLEELLSRLPPLARVTDWAIYPAEYKDFTGFRIIHSRSRSQPDLLIPPDVALCADCRRELYDPQNRRYRYPFITCTNCGPRYSIITALPYDRPNTTMAPFRMCAACEAEYHNPMERRHFSQTNSCPDCAVEMQWYESGHTEAPFTDLSRVIKYWSEGKIVAIKGIGGYLLTCDATGGEAVAKLRRRKRRPSKPFALMYPSVEILTGDVFASPGEMEALESREAPILLLKKRKHPKTHIATELIAPGLDTLGVMLPYTPLFDLLLNEWQKPIVATSGNISGDTIIYEDDEAMEKLSGIADAILMNNRRIVIPQDDSVMRFAGKRRIFLRRSRGFAPLYFPPGKKLPLDKAVLGTGAMLKSGFTLLHKGNAYVSQYLGDTGNYNAQLNYRHTYRHLSEMLDFVPEEVVSDKHPDYFSTRFGRELARKHEARYFLLQHHKAHFIAVLAENKLEESREPVLGVIMDGTGYGDDGNIWGGEFFLYHNGIIRRHAHLHYYPFITGDKMVKEPRLSLFCLADENTVPDVRNKFTEVEWRIYNRLKERTNLFTSSTGRLFDAAASLILNADKQTYEGEAAIRLEHAAMRYFDQGQSAERLKTDLSAGINLFPQFLIRLLNELKNAGRSPEELAAAFHVYLAEYIRLKAREEDTAHVAFSGGVFQNALLVELLTRFMKNEFQLYFHHQLSPNDENVSLGQVIWRVSGIEVH